MHHHHHHRFRFHFHRRERRDSNNNKGLERLYPLLRCRLFSLSEGKEERDLLDERRVRTVRDRKKTDALSLSVPLALSRTRRDSSVLKGSRRSKNVRFPLTAGQSRLVRAVFANDGNAADERSHLDVFEHRRVFQTPSVYRALEERIRAGLLHQRRSRWRSVLRYYARGALTPVDVVKTRMQLDPSKYSGMISGASKIAAEEGAGALLTGLAPTCFGYFVQGWFKFGGVEFFKIKAVESLGEQKAWDNKTNIYLGAAAGAEFIADVFLCPLEATRIRLVSNPSYASSMPGAMAKMASEEGIVNAFYSGFGPILAKQIPYTMAKFAVQGAAADEIYKAIGKTNKECTNSENLSVSLGSGVIAGVSAAIISHLKWTRCCLKSTKPALAAPGL